MMLENFKTKLSEKYLNFAEKLPVFQGGIVHTLQQIRKYQREESRMEYERNRPPEKANLELKSFRLLELFEVEQVENLERGLLKLFSNDKRIKETYQLSEYGAGSLSAKGWGNLGIITTASTASTIPFPLAKIVESIPQYIQYIAVSLHRILPSLYIVAFDFILKDDVSHKIKELQNFHYLPDVQFKKLIPRGGVVAGGYSLSAVRKVFHRNILGFLENIRLDAEIWVRRYLKGFHFHNTPGKKLKLPAIEIYRVKGNPHNEQELQTWKKEADSWFDSFNISISKSNFSKGRKDFIFERTSQSGHLSPCCLILFDIPSTKDDESEEELNGITSYLAIQSYLNGLRSFIERRRIAISKSLEKFKLKLIRSSNIQDNINLSRALMLLDRLEIEFAEGIDWFKYFNRYLSGFKNFNNLYQEDDLLSVIIKHIETEIEHIKKHICFYKNSLSEYINIQNLYVMFKLQRAIFYLTLIATIAAIVGLAINWDEIKLLLQNLNQYLVQYLL